MHTGCVLRIGQESHPSPSLLDHRCYVSLSPQGLLFAPCSELQVAQKRNVRTYLVLHISVPSTHGHRSDRESNLCPALCGQLDVYVDSLIHTATSFYTHFTNRGVQEILHRPQVADENQNKVCLVLDDRVNVSQTSASEIPERLFSMQVTGPHSRTPASGGLETVPWMCISSKWAGDADAAVQGPLWETLPLHLLPLWPGPWCFFHRRSGAKILTAVQSIPFLNAG